MQSEKKANVYIDLYGMMKGSSGKKRREISVASVLQDAVIDVKEYLATISASSSYILYFNDTFVKSVLEQNPGAVVSEGDVFKVIPIVAGG